MGIHGIFHYYTFYANWWENATHAARDMQMASQTHFPQMYK